MGSDLFVLEKFIKDRIVYSLLVFKRIRERNNDRKILIQE